MAAGRAGRASKWLSGKAEYFGMAVNEARTKSVRTDLHETA